jgi:hypothetical protein
VVAARYGEPEAAAGGGPHWEPPVDADAVAEVAAAEHRATRETSPDATAVAAAEGVAEAAEGVPRMDHHEAAAESCVARSARRAAAEEAEAAEAELRGLREGSVGVRR